MALSYICWHDGEVWDDIGKRVEEDGAGWSIDKVEPPYVWFGRKLPFAIMCVIPGGIWL